MAQITSAEIQWRYTVKTGSAGNSTASTAATSLGKYVANAASLFADGSTNGLFEDITGVQNAANQVDYKGVGIVNTNSANIYTGVTAFVSSEVAGGASVAIAVDSIAASAIGSASAQLQEATTSTAPGAGVTGLSYSAPTTAGTGLSMGNIGTSQVKGLWARRTAANTAALSTDGVTLAVSGDTGSL